MMGGLIEAVKERLQRENYYRTFLSRVGTETGKVFANITDANLSFAYPSPGFPPEGKKDFSNCQVS